LIIAYIYCKATLAVLPVDQGVGHAIVGVDVAPPKDGALRLIVKVETLLGVSLRIFWRLVPAEVAGTTIVCINTLHSFNAQLLTLSRKGPYIILFASEARVAIAYLGTVLTHLFTFASTVYTSS